MTRRGLPSTLRTDFRDDIQLLDSGFVRFWAAAGLVAALLLPLVLTNFWTGVANQVFIAVIGALALNLLTGTTGQISLGHAGFVAAGAFTVAALPIDFEAPIGFVLLAAAIVGAILGVLVGLPALRLKGLYLAVSTLAAHFVILVGVGQYQSTISYGSGFTIPSPSIFALEIGSERAWYFFLLPFALGVLLLNLNWLRSAYGRAWMAIRHRDVAVEALGINVALYKASCLQCEHLVDLRLRRAVGLSHRVRVGRSVRLRHVDPVSGHGHHRRARLGTGRVPRRVIRCRAASHHQHPCR